MILTRLALSGFGRFDMPHRLTGLEPGLNVLCGPNELGKSTLLAALRAAFLDKHTTSREEFLALATQGAELPMQVEVDFQMAGADWQLMKRFHRRARSELMQNGQLVATNTEADERVWSLLGLKAHSSRQMDPAALAALWVEQGQSHLEPALSEGLRTDLRAAIQQQVGTITGGGPARDVLKAVTALIERNETSGGRLRKDSPLQLADAAVAALEAEKAQQLADREALEPLRDQLASARDRLARAEDPQEEAAARSLIEATAQALAEARLSAARLERMESAVREAQVRRDLASRDLDQAREAAGRLADASQVAARAAQAAAEASVEADGQSAGAARAAQAAQQTRQAQLEAQASMDQLEARRDLEAARAQETAAAARVEQLSALARQIAEADQAAAAMRPALQALPALDAAERTLIEALARRDAASARFALFVAQAEGPPVLLDGEPVTGDHGPTPITARREIRLGHHAVLTLEPAAGGAQAADAVRSAQAGVADCLACAGADSPAALRAMAAAAARLEAELKVLRAQAGAGPEALAGAQSQLALARGQVQAALGRVAAAGAGADAGPPEAGALDSARHRLDQARLAAADAARALATAEARASAASEALARAVQQQELARQTLARELELASADQREAAVASASEALVATGARAAEAAQELADLTAALAGQVDPATLEARLARQQDALRRLMDERTSLHRDVAHLEARLAAAGDSGRDERLAALDDLIGDARARLARLTDEQMANRLLRQLLEEELAASEQRFTAPLRSAVQPYLDLLFPGAGLAVDEKLKLKGLDRRLAEPFGQLSTGTREQVSLFVRLALADLLAGPAGPLPLILDDALTHTDAARLQPVFDALHRAARSRQVLVFTCHETLARGLGGTRLSLERVDGATG
jgi:ABC-type cobalamin/Fe3+-siderophores transport system ATPase subunit